MYRSFRFCEARRFLFFLVGAGFLSIFLTACAGSGGSEGGKGGSSDDEAFKVELTFSPIADGFVIGNQSDFGDFVSVNITATSGSVMEWRNISITAFSDDSYNFTGLDDQSDWIFRIMGTLSHGRQEPVEIVLVWQQNIADHESGGIRPGNNTDKDGRADSVDEDDDNDGILDDEGDDCPTGETGWTSNPLTDNDMDGCRDAGEDTDDDNDKVLDLMDTGMVDGRECRLYEDCDDDGVDDDSEQCRDGETNWESNSSSDNDMDGCRDAGEDTDDDNDKVEDGSDKCSVGETGWMSNGSSDNDGDGCRDAGEDEDDDNDGLNDTDTKEQLTNSSGVSCRLLADCDNDGVGDSSDQCSAGSTGWTSNGDTDDDGDGCRDEGEDIDDDGDGLIEITTAVEFNSVRYALNGNGSRSAENAALDTTGCGGDGNITSCSGYELAANISLAAYRDGKGWQPLGQDTDSGTSGCQGAAFDGTFDGNGFVISDLNLSRSDEDCVGLFGRIAADSEIRNLRLLAETVIGRGGVGGLVGWGQEARIVSSAVVVEEIRGSNVVGGLVGWGTSAQIVSSSVVVGEVRGVGSGTFARTHLGGLVGWGEFARIYSSSVVAAEVNGIRFVGGLVGEGQGAQIYSCSVVVGNLSGSDDVGGLAGLFDSIGSRVAYSYVVSGSSTAMLSGAGTGQGIASYWDRDTSGVNSGRSGDPKSTSDLRSPTDYDGIYATWDDNPVIFDVGGMIDEPLAVWCDEDNSGSIEAGERSDDNRIWDFGTPSQYPAIRCTPLAPADWRSWWFLDGDGKPQLNQSRLDELFQ